MPCSAATISSCYCWFDWLGKLCWVVRLWGCICTCCYCCCSCCCCWCCCWYKVIMGTPPAARGSLSLMLSCILTSSCSYNMRAIKTGYVYLFGRVVDLVCIAIYNFFLTCLINLMSEIQERFKYLQAWRIKWFRSKAVKGAWMVASFFYSKLSKASGFTIKSRGGSVDTTARRGRVLWSLAWVHIQGFSKRFERGFLHGSLTVFTLTPFFPPLKAKEQRGS